MFGDGGTHQRHALGTGPIVARHQRGIVDEHIQGTELFHCLREHGVHRSTVQAWGKEGVLLGDPEAVKARVAIARRKESAAGAAAGETYTEARRRREIALANRAEIITQREAGKVIDIDSVETAFGQIGAEFRSRLLAMRGNLVTELEGQGAEGIYRILDQRFGELLTAIHSLSKT